MKSQSDALSPVFAALGDPTRRSILSRLRDGDATVAELAAPFPISQPAVSRHLGVLEAAGLISRRWEGTARRSHLEAGALRAATLWMHEFGELWGGAMPDHFGDAGPLDEEVRDEPGFVPDFRTPYDSDDEWII